MPYMVLNARKFPSLFYGYSYAISSACQELYNLHDTTCNANMTNAVLLTDNIYSSTNFYVGLVIAAYVTLGIFGGLAILAILSYQVVFIIRIYKLQEEKMGKDSNETSGKANL